MLCPDDAITETDHFMGETIEAIGGTFELVYGRLRVGEAAATPLIRHVKRMLPTEGVSILDCPPGTACTAVESIRGADLCVLVTEPTPFGLHDLRLAAEVAAELGVPAGVIVNRDGIGDAAADAFCADAGLPVLLRIPFERAIAEGIAQGRPLIEIRPEYGESFRALYRHVAEQVREHEGRVAARA